MKTYKKGYRIVKKKKFRLPRKLKKRLRKEPIVWIDQKNGLRMISSEQKLRDKFNFKRAARSFGKFVMSTIGKPFEIESINPLKAKLYGKSYTELELYEAIQEHKRSKPKLLPTYAELQQFKRGK